MPNETGPVILFDGVCNLCNSAVQFTIRNDDRKQFKFASLQSLKGEELLKAGGLDNTKSDSFVLISDGKYYTRSTAALKVLKALGGRFSLLYAFIIIPAFMRDGVYRLIAKNRYRFFGKRKECMSPTPELKSRFID